MLLASLFFYWYAMPLFLPLLLVMGSFCYLTARVVANRNLKHRKFVFSISLILLFAPLFLYKYLGFFAIMASSLLRIAGPNIAHVLPLGISFYTFGAVGYVIDCYNGSVKPERNFINCLLFVGFFPQIMSGPIGRAKLLIPQYQQSRDFDFRNLCVAGIRFLSGLFKKAVIADNLGVLVDYYYQSPGMYPIASVSLLVIILYAFQIYFDFSGYSDMAIAAGKLFGITLPENFDTPYLAVSYRDFWSRWHQSLTNWLTDYIFTPLVWSRWANKLLYRKNWQDHHPIVMVNIIIVFLVSGLWHGAAVTFVVWGAIQGVLRVLDEKLMPKKKSKPKSFAVRILRSIAVLLVSALAHVFFRADSIATAFEVFSGLFKVASPVELYYSAYSFVANTYGGFNPYTNLILGIVAASFVLAIVLDIVMFRTPRSVQNRAIPLLQLSESLRVMILCFMFLAIIAIGRFGTSNFIYFKF